MAVGQTTSVSNSASPAAVEIAAEGGKISSVWIARPWIDLSFFVATPLLIIPLVNAAMARWSIDQIALYVAAFGATGHHLPGMLRAYGDRELFERFRVRFLIAPVFLLTLCVSFAYWHLRGLVLIGVTWGTWHSLMQVYGFLRIYDGKVKSTDRITANLDFYMCLCWFIAGFLNSPGRLQGWFEMFYTAGGPAVTAATLSRIALTVNVATFLVTVGFVLNLVRRWGEGRPPSAIKLGSMAISFGFWWYAMVLVDNPLLGVALFEIFHDVQYLAIVWIFNRGRVDKAERVGSFTGFLFRRSGAMVGLYVALVVGYGIVGMVPEMTDLNNLRPAIFGFLLASGLLHFYYDGFIWKFREQSARRALNLADGQTETARNERFPSWVRHGAKWVFFVIPVIWLGTAQVRNPLTRLEQLQNLAIAVPESWNAHYMLAKEFQENGRLEESIPELEHAVRLNPEQITLHIELGDAYMRTNAFDKALPHLQKAHELDPRHDAVLRGICEILMQKQRFKDAETPLKELVARTPGDALAHRWLGTVLAERGLTGEAAARFEASLSLDPSVAVTHNNLGLMRLRQGLLDDAAAEFDAALTIDADYAEAHNNRGVVAAQRRDFRRAIEHYRRTVELDASHVRARNSLAWNLATCPDDELRNGREALQLAQSLTSGQGEHDLGILLTLAAAYAETGEFEAAEQTAARGLQLAQALGNRGMAALTSACLELYRKGRPYRDRGGM
ncbi:MAG: tetratricopeptide repeat protein [Planctomycetaceae bacterium]